MDAAQAILIGFNASFSNSAFGSKLEADLSKKGAAAKATATLSDVRNSARVVAAPRVAGFLFRAAATGLGTHGAKFPDTRVELGAMVAEAAASEASAAAPGVHSSSASIAFKLSGADAQLTSALRFLGMPISVAGSPSMQVAEILADKDNETRAEVYRLVERSVATLFDEVGAAVRARIASPVPADVDGNMRQVLVPIGNGEYVSVTPLYSYGLAAELSRRLRYRSAKAREEAQQSFSLRVAHVGGTKPQNSGVLPNFLGGEMPRLLAMPFVPTSGTREDALRRLRAGTVPLPDRKIRKEAIDKLKAAMAGPPTMRDTRTRIENALEDIVDGMLWAVTSVAEQASAAMASGGKLIDIADVPSQNQLVARIVGLDPDNPVTDQELEGVAEDVSEFIRARLDGKEYKDFGGVVQTFALGREDRMITEVALRSLREFS